MRDARGAERPAEILEVLVVGHFGEVDQVPPAIQEERTVAEGYEAPVVVDLAVVRQVFDLRHAIRAVDQVAELGAHLQPAIGEQARCEGGVIVRCDVPVPGYAELIAAPPGAADLGRQDAGLACIAEREGEIG